MRRIRNITAFFLILLLAASFTGCGDKTRDSEQDHQNEIYLFYLNKDEDGLKPVAYSFANPEDPEACAREVIFHLSDTEEDNTDQFKPSIYEGIMPPAVSVKDKMAVLSFETDYKQLSEEKEVLLRSSIVKSLVQIEGIESVTFTVNDSSLTGSDGKTIGTMTEDTFLLNRKELYSRQEEVTLYYANKDGSRLVPVKRTIEVTDNMPLETGMLLALIHDPGPEGCRNPLPSELDVKQTQIYNGICYVDLSSDIDDIVPEMEDAVKVYSMVNTLLSTGQASQVQFTVEGQPLPELNDFKNFDKPLTCNYTLTEKNTE